MYLLANNLACAAIGFVTAFVLARSAILLVAMVVAFYAVTVQLTMGRLHSSAMGALSLNLLMALIGAATWAVATASASERKATLLFYTTLLFGANIVAFWLGGSNMSDATAFGMSGVLLASALLNGTSAVSPVSKAAAVALASIVVLYMTVSPPLDRMIVGVGTVLACGILSLGYALDNRWIYTAGAALVVYFSLVVPLAGYTTVMAAFLAACVVGYVRESRAGQTAPGAPRLAAPTA